MNMNALLKPKNKKPQVKHKRIKIRNLSKGIPIKILEERIEEMAEIENAMSQYEHCVEAG